MLRRIQPTVTESLAVKSIVPALVAAAARDVLFGEDAARLSGLGLRRVLYLGTYSFLQKGHGFPDVSSCATSALRRATSALALAASALALAASASALAASSIVWFMISMNCSVGSSEMIWDGFMFW